MYSVSSRIKGCHEKQVPKSSGSTTVYNLSPPQFGMFAIDRAKLPSWCFVLRSPPPQKHSVHMLSLSPNRTGRDQSRGVHREQQAHEYRSARGWFLSPELAVEQITSCLNKLMYLKLGFGIFLCLHEKGGGRGLLSVLFIRQMVTPQNNE